MKVYNVTIVHYSSKYKKYQKDNFELNDIPSVARCLLTYQPKRQYEFVSFDVELVEKLL